MRRKEKEMRDIGEIKLKLKAKGLFNIKCLWNSHHKIMLDMRQ